LNAYPIASNRERLRAAGSSNQLRVGWSWCSWW